jgi:uncharacterized membrane protein
MTRRRSDLKAWWTHLAFEIGIFFKGLDGVVEVVGGLLLLLVHTASIEHLVRVLTWAELSEDPRDLVATTVVRLAGSLTEDLRVFAALYLLIHGVVKVVLVVALFRSRLWAYPAAIGVFGAFVAYQMYRYVLQPSGLMLFLSVVDLVVIGLTWNEYRNLEAGRYPVGRA